MKKIALILTISIVLFPIKIHALENSASSMTIMDMDTNRIIYNKEGNTKKLIASITKIMTAIIAIESGKINDMVTVDESILKSYGSGIYIEIGEEITLLDLVYGLMLRSGNDAAVMIANYIGGSIEGFAKLMNDKANYIGMTNTIFYNPHGLDEETKNLSTSYDMSLLTSYAMKNDIYKKIVSTKKYVVKTNKKTYMWKNKNKLLTNYEYTTGGKTGFTDKARRTLVTTASKNNLNIVVVTLNDPSDFTDHKNAYEYVFKNYNKYKILNKNTFKVENNKYNKNLYIKNDYYYTIRNDEENKLNLNVKLEKDKRNIKNNIVGVVEVKFDNKIVHSENIYLEQNKVETKKSWFQKFLDLFK